MIQCRLSVPLELFIQFSFTLSFSRDFLGWAVLLNFLVYITIPVVLQYTGILLGVGSFAIYINTIIGLAKKENYFWEQVNKDDECTMRSPDWASSLIPFASFLEVNLESNFPVSLIQSRFLVSLVRYEKCKLWSWKKGGLCGYSQSFKDITFILIDRRLV